MTRRLSSLVVGLSVAAGVAVVAIACSQPNTLPVSPSATPVSGFDGTAAKGYKNFCAYVLAHAADPIYVIGQDVSLSLVKAGTNALTDTSAAPHGEVCFPVPAGTEYVYLDIQRATYCPLNWVQFEVHGGPSYIWLLPAAYHDCSYDDEPY